MIDRREGTITSPFGTLHTADTTSSVVKLVDGDYVIEFSAHGFASNWSSAYSRLFSYTRAGEYLGVLVMDYADNLDAGCIAADSKTCFRVTDAGDRIFVWDSGATAQGGTVSYSARLSRVDLSVGVDGHQSNHLVFLKAIGPFRLRRAT
ncbi:hypothetical protein [Aliirhizobium smilacinae]|uniref:Uncharacterized protein n=1 Tax=Aliirhizobium smilacinae TaxID=1395944 RepID=A0A5C4XPU4_9HYPH|nr:hypothetical protein [Rhizobium smilacinae]TNM65269.1 hypothetical protein FHP24_03030 [Rhizobium smilacinae]